MSHQFPLHLALCQRDTWLTMSSGAAGNWLLPYIALLRVPLLLEEPSRSIPEVTLRAAYMVVGQKMYVSGQIAIRLESL